MTPILWFFVSTCILQQWCEHIKEKSERLAHRLRNMDRVIIIIYRYICRSVHIFYHYHSYTHFADSI